MDEQHKKLKEQYWNAVQFGSADDVYCATKALLQYEERLIENVKETLMFKNLLANKG